jgi:hypothetical protein
MVRVTARRLEDDGAGPKSSGLALHSRELAVFFNDEVVTCVLPKRQQNGQAGHPKREHYGEGRPIPYVLRVV